jgi:hypothetical protein
MQTRRQLLQHAIVLPFAAALSSGQRLPGVEIIAEPDCLSEESARGFSLIALPSGRFVVACGAGGVAMARAQELLGRAMRGEWIIWESSPPNVRPEQFSAAREHMQSVFGIRLGEPVESGMYVHYEWPHAVMTRSFMHAIPVRCSSGEVTARHAGMPIAMRRRFGSGGIVFLGSMLGPNLHAQEAEAQRIGTAIFQELARANS